MNEIDKANAEIRRGNEAAQVINSSIRQEALIAIKADLFDKFMKTKSDEADKRETIYLQLQAFERETAYLESVIKTGKIGTQTLSLLERSKKVIGL